MNKPFCIAEIGINHNGDLSIAKKLIGLAKEANFSAVKFQKRSIDLIYSPEELSGGRDSPFGTTFRQQKEGLEFSRREYDEIDQYCRESDIDWFASAWDLDSLEFLNKYNLSFNKVASPMITVLPLVEAIAKQSKYTFISTGMSTLDEIDNTVAIFKRYNCPFELMHCNSSYPTEDSYANLACIKTLRNRYQCKVGYSGHEKGIQITLAAVALGVSSIERHITLDVYMYGSDQFASLPPSRLRLLGRLIEIVPLAMGTGEKYLRKEEISAREKLALPYWFRSSDQ